MRKLGLIGLIFLSITCFAQEEKMRLDKGWEFRLQQDKQWFSASVPGTIHTDLLSHKRLPDPFYRNNEAAVQWVEQDSFLYRLHFDVPAAVFSKKLIQIEFDGLDTYAEVWLNGNKIISANNMFRQWTAQIKPHLRKKDNQLLILFLPSAQIAQQLKKSQAMVYPDNERVFVRKAQYQFGWDWGPRLVTGGIWKSVRIRGRNTQDQGPATVSTKPRVELVQQQDSVGTSFYFTVDGVPTFMKGANWIPADNFLPRAVKTKRYEELIRAAREANINMLRVWGGGIYEDDVFYELCTRYGIMVWQDFMFAGALYPSDSDFLSNVEAEVRYQVKRLRRHPCIVIWCGNNEIEEAWFNWGWQRQFHYSVEDSVQLWNGYKKIFHELIPGILRELDPQRPYWPSSPSLGWGRDSAYKKGDVHYWGVWWGREPVSNYRKKSGRFVSEYGMQGMPNMKTLQQFSLPEDLDTSSVVMKAHQKHPFGWENIRYYIEQKFPVPKNFEDLVYTSQLMQADAIRIAIEAHRNSGPGRLKRTMGSLFWQWNDCWPVTSWSAIDYYGRKKALYYQVKRSFDEVALVLDEDETSYKIHYVGDSLPAGARVDIIRHALSGTNDNAHHLILQSPLGSRPMVITKKSIFNEPSRDAGNTCLLARVLVPGKKPSTFIFFLDDPKNLSLSPARISFEFQEKKVKVIADKPAYGIYLDVPDGVNLEDNYFHLVPGEVKWIAYHSLIPAATLQKSTSIKTLADIIHHEKKLD